MTTRRLNTLDITMRKGFDPIVCLTAYTAPIAKLIDHHTDLILVGDSLGMVLYGMDSTLSVDVEMMVRHGRAVVKSSSSSCVVVDMPFGSYQKSKEQAFSNAALIMEKTGCSAVKLEGGVEMAGTVEFLTSRGIPVMGHIGLKPQSVNTHGGYKFQGKTEEQRHQILEDGKAIEAAGAFSIVLESTVYEVANEVTKAINVPVIGIGASEECDGQILVTEDMIGLNTEFVPRFVKQYASIHEDIAKAAKSYAADVKERSFPTEANILKLKK